MGEMSEERLAVLRMVAAGTVSPRDALDLLSALEPDGAQPRVDARGVADGPIAVRVHFRLDEKEADFVLPVEPSAPVADVFARALQLLPRGAGDHLPEGLGGGWGSATVAQLGEGLLHFQDGPFELHVTREAPGGRSFGRRGRGFVFHG